MSAARYALLKLEDSPPHVKNWRPQILLLLKCNESKGASNQLHEIKQQMSEPAAANAETNLNDFNYNIEVSHPNVLAFISQLKAGKGLFVGASVVSGDFAENREFARACKKTIKRTMEQFKVKGFCDSLVSYNLEQGLCHL
jgi:potassium/chloride transporter 4/5/6